MSIVRRDPSTGRFISRAQREDLRVFAQPRVTLSALPNATYKKAYDVAITVKKEDGVVYKLGKQDAPQKFSVYASAPVAARDVESLMHDKVLTGIVTASCPSAPGDIIGAEFTPITGGDIMASSLYGSQSIMLTFGGLEIAAISNEDCVPAAIEATMKRKSPADLLTQLNMKTRTSGTTAENLIKFCATYDIALNLCDVGYNILHQSEGKAGVLNGLIQQTGTSGHLYHITDKRLINIIFNPVVICNIKASRTQRCTGCKLTFVSQIEQIEHMLAMHETRAIVRVDNIINELQKYIKTHAKIPMINCNVTHFYDATTRYVQKIDRWVHNGISYASVTQYANGILRASCGEKYLSTVNTTLCDIFNQNTTAYVEQFSSGPAYEYDIKKCYTAIIATGSLPVFAFDDEPRAFSGHFSSLAFYGVRNQGCHGKLGYLISPLVRLYLEIGRITIEDIITELIPQSTCSLREFVNQVYKTDMSADDKKAAINNAIGCLSHHVRTTNQRSFITSSDSDYVHHRSYTNQRSIPHEIYHLGGEIMLHTQNVKTPDNINARPAWHYIIQMGRYTLEKAAHHIRENGGEVMEISTDAIYTKAPIDLPPMFPPVEIINSILIQGADPKQAPHTVTIRDIGQWKPAKKCIRAPRNFEQAICPTINATQHQTIPYNLVVCDSLLPNTGCLILGAPGTGKTTLWRTFKATLPVGQIVELAFQNNVVANLNSATASTFHKKLMIKKNEKRAGVFLSKKFAGIKYIFIDEIQMTPAVIRPFLIWLKQTLKIVFYCAGDFDQWADINNPFNQDASWLKEITDNNLLTLTVNHRNTQMHNIHNWQLKTAHDLSGSNATKYHIAYRNTTVNNINSVLLSTRHDVSIPYMCCQGDKKLGLVKGRHYLLTKGKITLDPAFHSDTFNLKFAPEYAPLFTLGYAFTCHKTIGLTITADYTIHTVGEKFEHIKKIYDYVARSRAVSLDQIYIMNDAPHMHDMQTIAQKNMILCHMALHHHLVQHSQKKPKVFSKWTKAQEELAAQAIRDDPDLQPDNIQPELTPEEWAAEAEMAGLD
jgi:hypothetical protein